MNKYKVISTWSPDIEYATPMIQFFDTLDEAEGEGQRNGCMSGIRCVEVFSPDGSLEAIWDKSTGNNIWQSVGIESKALKAFKNKLIMNCMKAGMSTIEAADYLKSYAPIVIETQD